MYNSIPLYLSPFTLSMSWITSLYILYQQSYNCFMILFVKFYLRIKVVHAPLLQYYRILHISDSEYRPPLSPTATAMLVQASSIASLNYCLSFLSNFPVYLVPSIFLTHWLEGSFWNVSQSCPSCAGRPPVAPHFIQSKDPNVQFSWFDLNC